MGLCLSEQWINEHWRKKEWNDRFIARVNDLADFTDRVALRLLKKDDFALASWHTLQDQVELTLKDESVWTSFANNLLTYVGDAGICLFYVLFLVAPPRTPEGRRSKIGKRIHKAVKRFVMIMVALSAVRATLWASSSSRAASRVALDVHRVVSFWLFFVASAPAPASSRPSARPPPGPHDDAAVVRLLHRAGLLLSRGHLGPVWYQSLDLSEVVILSASCSGSAWGGVGRCSRCPS